MRVRVSWLTLLVVIVPAGIEGIGPSAVEAQMVTRSVGLVGVSTRFYERTGGSFGFGFGGGSGLVGCFGRFGSGGYASPAFGRIQSSGGLSAGWSVRGGSVANRFGLHAVRRMQRGFVSSTGLVTGLSGYPVTMSNGVYVPFVTGMIPFGGNAPYWIHPQWLSYYGGLSVVPMWGNGFPQRAWPVAGPRQTLADRWKVARRRFAETPLPRDRDRRLPRLPAATGTGSLSTAAFRQLGGRPSRR
ncbi:MAG: hypothetical protein VB859_11730 [Planctomycetaceae bacterium]